ncbi:MAG TPA: type I-MYXAN CRISPR-associated protein Cmx8 [Vicinamibacterales bacterium]|jgi:CRISPR-associated protein Cmx8|nr:type I-MYXAN CRISPR-associated protein Cmx8 [Vicinamibacterales bacterium]
MNTHQSRRPRKTPKDTDAVAAGRASGAASVLKLRWDLAELPSSQHKAGLGGLALCVKFLERKPERKGVCRIESIDERGLTLEVDRSGMQALFDDVYDASFEEQRRPKILQRKRPDGTKQDIPPKRVEEERIDDKGRAKTRTVFIYDQAIPRGALLDEWDAAPSGSQKLWLKLWRDFVWSTLRGVPSTRRPYEARAERESIPDGEEVWDQLKDAAGASVDLPSTYYVGAQAKSAENVSFRDTSRYRFLLHFWPFAVAIYAPFTVNREGERRPVGFALSVPDIVDLAAFVDDWARLARERSPEAFGYRPRDAVVDVAAEGGLDLVARMFQLIGRKQGAAATSPWLTAVDVFHVEKDGNNVRLRGVSRLDVVRERSDEYARVRGSYRSPIFRRQRIASVLGGVPWWTGFGRVCAIAPDGQTIRSAQFQHDARIAFTEVEMRQSEQADQKSLEQLIYQTVRAYVYKKLASKYGLEWDATKGASDTWKHDYDEKKSKVARDAFLAVRSRTGTDFIAYFTSTICSVPQHMGDHGYLAIAHAFNNAEEIERIRSLTLLALSASA